MPAYVWRTMATAAKLTEVSFFFFVKMRSLEAKMRHEDLEVATTSRPSIDSVTHWGII